MADDLTLDVARRLVEAERIGQRSGIDMLAIGLSATDYVGHVFGPSSLEAEDNILRLDAALAELFAFVDDKVGLENTLIVLAADHGGPGRCLYDQRCRIHGLFAAVVGVSTGGIVVMIYAIFPDIPDVDELMTGERREGMYGSIFWWVVKLGMAAALAGGGFLLNATGFDVALESAFVRGSHWFESNSGSYGR